jgi:very-short-patch-repair endonuclease
MSTEPNELEESLKSPIGQIEPILRCKQHPERILSGRHRDKILNKQGKTARAQLYDCDELARRESISHGLAHWLVTSAANVRRQIPEDERQADVMQMAVVLDADGVPPEKRAQTIARLTGLTTRRVEQLLPKEHKREYNSETISQSPTEEKQRFSETVSKFRVSTYTQAEQLFIGNLSYYNIKYRTQEPFVRAGEFSNGGQQKTFVADIYLPDKNVIIELEGSGSASSDNQHRDDYFKEKGIPVVHLRNETVVKDGAGIASLIKVLSK